MSLHLYAAAAALTLFTPLLMMLVDPPQPDGLMLVILPPWKDADRIIEAAGGVRVGPENAPFASFAQSENPAFIAKVQSLGAWAVRGAARLDQMCGTL